MRVFEVKGEYDPGNDKYTTWDGLSLNWFTLLWWPKKTGKFKFSPARRVEIPKSPSFYFIYNIK